MINVHVHTLLPYACMHLLLHIFLSTCELLALLGIHALLYPFSLHQRSNFLTVKLRYLSNCMSCQQPVHIGKCV